LWEKVEREYETVSRAALHEGSSGNLPLLQNKYEHYYAVYERCASKLNEDIDRVSASTSQARTAPPTETFSRGCSLPPCDTEIFDGDYLLWPTFRDLFTAIYVNNSRLTPVEKLFHLNAKTSGEAHAIVSKSPLTNDGFQSAWSALHDPRALLDSGSQINFMAEDLAQRLRLHREESYLNITTVGKNDSVVRHKVHTSIHSRVNAHSFATDFWVLRSISSYQPDYEVNYAQWKIPANIELADPRFHKPAKVDLLIGAESFFELLSVGQIKLGSDHPSLQKTLLGWIVSGKYTQRLASQAQVGSVTVSENISSLDSLVERFWELEQVPERSKAVYTAEQRRLANNCELQDMYHEFMREYLNLGHMSRLPTPPPGQHYYIPHQCVLRPDSSTTKLRVVFDASSKTSTSISLNETLMVGATIQRELYAILARFRLNKYALTSDISKMYRQVNVANEDRNFQLILWREKSTQALQTFRLNTVTYGTASAPFLAIRCLFELSKIYAKSHPVAAEVISSDFYVDDMLTGANSLDE
ncbi:hypothetical protein KR059_000207, partial [Drosophila kikkawai]